MDFLSKLQFLLKRPKVIIVTGEGRVCAKEAIFQILRPYFKVGKDFLIFETDLTNSTDIEKFKFLIKYSSLPILVVTQVGDIPADKIFFAGEQEKILEIRKLAEGLPSRGYLILNFDDETVKEIKNATNLQIRRVPITFGFQERVDFQATDIKLNPIREYDIEEHPKSVKFSNGVNGGANFKINYKGNIVPVWLAPIPNFDVRVGKKQIYSALASACVGTIFDLNLVEISQALKNIHCPEK